MRHVAEGQPFSMSAEEFNSHQVAAAFVAAQQTRRGLPQSGPLLEIDRTRPWVVSESSELIRAFSCVKITGVAATHDVVGSDFYSKTPLKVNKPTGDTDSFLILQDGLPSQSMATRAVSDGITPAWVTFETEDESEGSESEGSEESEEEEEKELETAGPTANSFDLKAGGSGVEIIWKPEGTGSLLCVVRFATRGGTDGCCYNFDGVLLEDLVAGGSARCTLQTPEGIDFQTVEVTDKIMPGGSKISAGTHVYVAKFHGCIYRVTGVACDSLGLDACGLYLEDE